MQPTTEFVPITPLLAAVWLKSNTSNRRISEPVVEAYASDMRAGAWKLTHQGIAFDASGRLIDGQHRLHAIIKAGFPVTMSVTRGLAASAQEVVDAQKPRSISDQLHLIDGLPSANKYAGACRVIAEIEQGKHVDRSTLNGVRAILARYQPEIAEMLKAMRATEFDSVTIVGPLAYCMAADKAKVKELASQIRTGEGLHKYDPAYQIREWIRKYGCRERYQVMGVILRGTYAYLHGEQINHFRAAELADRSSPIMSRVVEFFQVANRT